MTRNAGVHGAAGGQLLFCRRASAGRFISPSFGRSDPAVETDRTTCLRTRVSPGRPAPDGDHFPGPLRRRAVVGFRASGAVAASSGDPVVGDLLRRDGLLRLPAAGIDERGVERRQRPRRARRPRDLGRPGRDRGRRLPACQNRDARRPRRPDRRAVAASSDLPGGRLVPTAASHLGRRRTARRTAAVRVPIPAGTPLGTYRVTLTATRRAPSLRRTNTATITVVDRIAPGRSASARPSEGAAFARRRPRPSRLRLRRPAQRHRRADLRRPGRHRRGASTPPAPGEKTFRVTTTDAAGNTTVATRRYRVLAPPPPERLDFTLAFDFSRATTSTRFTRLLVKEAPRGATLDGHLPRPLLPHPPRGAAPAARRRSPQRIGTRAITLRPWIRQSLRAGTVLTVTVTRPGAVGRVKTLTVRTNRRPLTRTTCLRPNSKIRARLLLGVSRILPRVGLTRRKPPEYGRSDGMTCFGGIQEDADDGFDQ